MAQMALAKRPAIGAGPCSTWAGAVLPWARHSQPVQMESSVCLSGTVYIMKGTSRLERSATLTVQSLRAHRSPCEQCRSEAACRDPQSRDPDPGRVATAMFVHLRRPVPSVGGDHRRGGAQTLRGSWKSSGVHGSQGQTAGGRDL